MSSRSFRFILIGVVLLIILIGGYLFMSTREKSTTQLVTSFSPSPSASATTTASPIPTSTGFLAQAFALSPENIDRSQFTNPPADFTRALQAISLEGGQGKRLVIADGTRGPESATYLFWSGYPQNISQNLGSDTIAVVYGQKEGFDQNGQLTLNSAVQKRLILALEIKDPTTAKQALSAWEVTMTNDLSVLFQYDPTKAATDRFLDGNYKGVAIRYRNFPYPDRSLDYAVVSLSNGKSYIVFSNSRETILYAIDKLQQ